MCLFASMDRLVRVFRCLHNYAISTKMAHAGSLTVKVPITTVADDKCCGIFPNFRKKGIIFNENCLPADNSHEISCLICSF